jgi:hypothetical protein
MQFLVYKLEKNKKKIVPLYLHQEKSNRDWEN